MNEQPMTQPILFKIDLPAKCELCGQFQTSVMYDAILPGGAWAYMCERCWRENALWKHTGVGKGQKYVKQDGNWVKE